MLAIFVSTEFGKEVNALVADMGLPLKLGSKPVELGPHVGTRFVSCAIFGPKTGWAGIITKFCSGGTARIVDGNSVTISPAAGRTVEFTGPTGTVWGPFTIEEINPADLFIPKELP